MKSQFEMLGIGEFMAHGIYQNLEDGNRGVTLCICTRVVSVEHGEGQLHKE